MESTLEESAEGLAIVRVLAAVLERLVCANSPLARTEPGQVTKFHALKAPGIGIQQYLERIHKYASCSSQCFIMALIYIDRLIQRNNFLLTELNVHRVIVTAILLAAKFFDDAYYNNAYYAKVGGVLVSEMNGLEVDFLFRINFSLHVTPELFEQYRVELLSHSGAESLPLPPPPQPQFMEQRRASPQLSQHEALLIHGHRLHHQSAMVNAAVTGLTFPLQTVQPPRMHPQITPSPPTTLASTLPTASAAPAIKPADAAELLVAAAVNQPTIRSNLQTLFPHEFGYLQRANSLPVQAKSLVSQVAQPQPLSAPAMMAMVPGVLNHHTFPGLVDAATAAAAAAADQFVVLDNQVYPLPPGIHPHQHRRVVMNASDLIHHVHHPTAAVGTHRHHVSGFVSREAAVSQRFVTGQMVAGVSGGL